MHIEYLNTSITKQTVSCVLIKKNKLVHCTRILNLVHFDGSGNNKEKEKSPEHKMVQVLESPSH